MTILGIHDGHNSSAALFDGNCVIAAIQEERLRYSKNWTGFPEKSIQWVLDYSGLSMQDVDQVVFNGNYMPPDLVKDELIQIHKLRWNIQHRIKKFLKKTTIGNIYRTKNKKARIEKLTALGFANDKISFIEHHECHVAASYYGWAKFDEPILVLSCDGAGDSLSATVNIGEKGKLTRIASISENESLGSLYACITTVMGFVPLEHEYKLMGMAPYADPKYANEVAKLFREHFSFSTENSMIWKRRAGSPPPFFGYWYWRKVLEGKRFDSVMAGLQIFVEEFISQWVKNCIMQTGIRKVALGGGFFMNVKANQITMDLDEVEDIFIFPSCGDEMNAIGACYSFYAKQFPDKRIPPLNNIYWGPEYSNEEVEKRIIKYPRKSEISFRCYGNEINKKVAELLANGDVVARFHGREEMGARSLGNRAILANPTHPEVITTINKMIKKRDFWMPFASSIKIERRDDYIVNQKKIEAPFMILTFDTTEKGREELRAGTHPQDYTIRPQEVSRENNPEYWDLITEFETLTKLGGILNTSFNLHGYPIVNTPEQALDVLLESGLKYLQLQDFLVECSE